MAFQFEKDAKEPSEEPDGRNTYVFEKITDNEIMEVSGDPVDIGLTDDGWRGVRYRVGDSWRSWRCLGRKDVLEYRMEIEDIDTYSEASNSTLGEMWIEFAVRNPDTVAAWNENDLQSLDE